MQKILNFLSGKKTYIVAFATAIYGAGVQTGLWPHFAFIDFLLGAGGLAALRAGVEKAGEQK